MANKKLIFLACNIYSILAEYSLHSYTFRWALWPMGLWLVGPFVNFHTSCVRTAKAMAGLHICAGSPEPSLVAYMISTKILWAGSVIFSARQYDSKYMYIHVNLFIVSLAEKSCTCRNYSDKVKEWSEISAGRVRSYSPPIPFQLQWWFM